MARGGTRAICGAYRPRSRSSRDAARRLRRRLAPEPSDRSYAPVKLPPGKGLLARYGGLRRRPNPPAGNRVDGRCDGRRPDGPGPAIYWDPRHGGRFEPSALLLRLGQRLEPLRPEGLLEGPPGPRGPAGRAPRRALIQKVEGRTSLRRRLCGGPRYEPRR